MELVRVGAALLFWTVLAGLPLAARIREGFGPSLILASGISVGLAFGVSLLIHLLPGSALWIWVLGGSWAVWAVRAGLKPGRRLPPRPERFDAAMLGAALTAAFIASLPHRGFPYPMHLDELFIVWKGAHFARQGAFHLSGGEWHHLGVEGLYGLILLTSRADPFRALASLPAWFAGLSALAAGYAVTRLTRDRAAGLCTAFLWGVLRSDGRLLGTELFVGSTLGLFLTLVLAVPGQAGQGQPGRRPVPGGLEMLFLVPVRLWAHASTGLLVAATRMLAVERGSFGLRLFLPLLAGLVFLFPFAAVRITESALRLTGQESSLGVALQWAGEQGRALVFTLPAGSGDGIHPLTSMVGPVTGLLALAGLLGVLTAGRPGAGDRLQGSFFLPACFVLTAGAALLAPVVGGTSTARPERLFYQAQALAVPMAGLGVWFLRRLVLWVSRASRSDSDPPAGKAGGLRGRTADWGAAFLVVAALGWRLATPDPPRYWRYMDQGLHSSLIWAGENLDPEERILALPSDAILLRTMGLDTTPVAMRWTETEYYKPILDFFDQASREERDKVLRTWKPKAVFSRRPLAWEELVLVAGPDQPGLEHYVYSWKRQ